MAIFQTSHLFQIWLTIILAIQPLVFGDVYPPSTNDHQDYYLLSRGFRTKPSFAAASGRGAAPNSKC